MSRKINDLKYHAEKKKSLVHDLDFLVNLETRKANKKKKKINREHYKDDPFLSHVPEELIGFFYPDKKS